MPGINTGHRAYKRSHGTLLNPGIRVRCGRRLTWSYQQSISHGHIRVSSVSMLACPLKLIFQLEVLLSNYQNQNQIDLKPGRCIPDGSLDPQALFALLC